MLSSQQTEVSESSRNQLDKNIRLAQELNANVVSLSGNVIADAIINFAKEKNITLIVAGLSHRSRFEELLKGSVLNDLTKKSGQINVLIVGSDSKKASYEKYFKAKKGDCKPYLLSFISVCLVLFFGCFFRTSIDPFNTAMLLLLPVVASSILWGSRVGLFTSVLSVAGFDFFLVEPFFTFKVSDIRYLPSFFVFIIISLIVSILAKEIRHRSESAKHREKFLSSLYSFSRDVMIAKNTKETIEKVSTYITDAFECELVV